MTDANPKAGFSPEAGAVTAGALRGSARRRRKERIIGGTLFGAAAFSVAVSLAIVATLFGHAIGFVSRIDLSQLWADGWFPRRQLFGIPTIFVGSLLVAGIAMLVATPIGLGAAIYLSEYASGRVRRALKPVIETLASIPSVVMGFFALTVINPVIVKTVFGTQSTFTIMSAGIGVGILTVPLVASVAEDAMHAVPGALREAAYGIGARRREVTTRVVFPAAVSGVVAALILGISRALGETMVVAIAAGGTGGAVFHLNPLIPGQTMTGAVAALAVGSDVARSEEFNSLYLVGLLLFVFTFSLNLVSDRFVRRTRRRY